MNFFIFLDSPRFPLPRLRGHRFRGNDNNVFYWGNPEMLFFSLFLILKGNFYSCAVGRDLSLFYLHIEFDHFCNSQILKALASCINGVFCCFLPGSGACSDKFDDFVYAIHNVPPLMESGLIPVNARTVKLSFAIVNNDC